jgi:hypothetical protein
LEDRCVLSTFTVTTTADDIDGGTLLNPAGPDGTLSLREAITVANLSSGTDTIAFNILGLGVQTILPGSALPTIADPVIIDGTTQPSGSIELDGTSAGATANGLDVQAGNSTIRGLAINRFAGNGILMEVKGGDMVQQCFLGTDFGGTVALGNNLNGILINNTTNNTIGGTVAGTGNVISGNHANGVFIQGVSASGNMVQGNIIGTNLASMSAIPNTFDGVRISLGASNVIGNSLGDLSPGARNTISGNGNDGVHIQSASAINNVIVGNYIGVNSTGNAALGNTVNGVELEGAVNTILGFTLVNVIGGNGVGITLDNGAQHNAVINNYVGVGADGSTPVGNLGQGIVLRSFGTAGELPVQQNMIGGTAVGTGNRIAFNGLAGLAVFGKPVAGNGQLNTGNQILGNSIFGNGTTNPTFEVGIDLVANSSFPTDDGVTPNHVGGPVAGPNNLQNFPVLTGAAVNRNNAGTIVSGMLNSAPNTTFRIELFDNLSASQTGFGQGQTLLTFVNVTTDASGNATFSANLTPTVPLGHFLTATATDPNGNTSEFSKAIPVVSAGTDIAGRVDENGQWWMAQSTGSTFANRLWTTWNPLLTWDDVVMGDFNGDGLTDIAGRVDETGQWWVALSNGSSFANQLWTAWNPLFTWDDVMVGDFNGDGKADIAGRVDENGQWWVALSNGTSFTNQLWTTWNTAFTWDNVMVGKFSGGKMDDIVGRTDESGQWWVAQSTGGSFANRLWTTWNTRFTWDDVVTGDFNGDGLTDIAGRVDESGQWWVALSNGSSFANRLWTTWNPLLTWDDVMVGDFNGDGIADIAGRVDENGQWWVALSNGSTMFANQLWTTWNTGVGWDDVQVGDFNNDGKMDLAGRVDENGLWWVAQSTGTSFTNQLWTTWNPAFLWVDVNAGKF